MGFVGLSEAIPIAAIKGCVKIGGTTAVSLRSKKCYRNNTGCMGLNGCCV